MFKFVAKEIWALDAEWVPDPAAGRTLYSLSDTLTDREVIQEMWQRNGATDENPMPYLKTVMCRVVSISVVIRKEYPDGQVKLILHSLPNDFESKEDQEASILSRFLTGLGQRKPQLIGFNSQSADLKILIQRGIVRGIAAPEFCKRPEKLWEGQDYFARTGDWHIDLKDLVSSWGQATPSLHELATLSGIPGNFNVTGQHVAEMWLAGDTKGIMKYNEFDALTTYLVWLRVAHFAGFFNEVEYHEEQERVRQMIYAKYKHQRYEHLLTYQTEWDNRLRARG